MRVTAAYRMADRLAEGRLAEIVAEYRGERLSWEDIARRLYADHGVEVAATTLKRWFETQGAA